MFPSRKQILTLYKPCRMAYNGGYNNTHRAFLQALLARQVMTYEEAKPLIAAIETAHDDSRPRLAEDVSQPDFDNYVEAVSTHISPFDFEIRHTLHQQTKQRVYALVNTTSDPLTQMATIHTADEIAFVKRVLDAMFETYNTMRAEVMALTSMQAVRLAKPPHPGDARRESGTQSQASNAGLTIAQAEKVLRDLVHENWFELSRNGFYSLSPRALIELRDWLVETYNGQPEQDDDDDGEDVVVQQIKLCQACRDIVTVGQRCPNLRCAARLHSHCVQMMWRTQGGQEQCPQCRTAWAEPPPVGEKAARPRKSSVGNGTARTGRRSTGSARNDVSADDGAEDE